VTGVTRADGVNRPVGTPLAWADVKGNAVTGAIARERQAVPGATGREPEISPASLASPRLRLRPDRSGVALLDGGWWPRSADPATELPRLILALDERHGRITRVMLGAADWNASRPRRIRVDGPAGSRVVRLGWFASMPAGLLTAISANGERTDLVTIPPGTGEQDAAAAMEQAAQAGNREHAPAILAGITAAAVRQDGQAPIRG
jgi:hypothetical protein